MQIREHGKQLLMIRTAYNKEKKRTEPVTVAKQERYMSTVSDNVRQQLTNDEVEHLEKWLSQRTEKSSVSMLNYHLSTIDSTVRQATEAMSVPELAIKMNSERATELYLLIGSFEKALKKAGYKKTKQTKELSVDGRQILLVSDK